MELEQKANDYLNSTYWFHAYNPFGSNGNHIVSEYLQRATIQYIGEQNWTKVGELRERRAAIEAKDSKPEARRLYIDASKAYEMAGSGKGAGNGDVAINHHAKIIKCLQHALALSTGEHLKADVLKLIGAQYAAEKDTDNARKAYTDGLAMYQSIGSAQQVLVLEKRINAL